MPEFKNIAQLPPSAQKIITDYGRKLLAVHGDNIICIAVYGSAAGVNFTPGISDINIAVVFRALDFDVFDKSLQLTSWGRKRRITAPLFLTADYIRDSLDIFPIEFSEIKDQHVVIFGEDIFLPLCIDARHMRLLCEAQIKGKLLRVRQAYLESGGNARVVKNILKDSLNSLMPVFRQLVRLAGGQPSIHRQELLKQLAAQFSMDVSVLTAIYHDKQRIAILHPSRAREHLKDYLKVLEHLAARIDQL